MNEQEQTKLIEDIDALYKSYSNAGFLKRNFKFGSFRKSFSDILADHHATEETLFKILLGHSIISRDSPRNYTTFLESVSRPSSYHYSDKYIMPPSVHTFLLLSLIFHDRESNDVVITIFMEAFDIIKKNNRVTTLYSDVEPGPLWKEPGIPLLLESLIQLISAEKTKVIVTGIGNIKERCCWIRSATNSIKLAQLALKELEKEPLFSNLPIQEMTDSIVRRANGIVTLSEEEAKSCENFHEMQDDNTQPGGWHPWAGYAEIQAANAKKVVDFVKELREYMGSTNTAILFQKYLASY